MPCPRAATRLHARTAAARAMRAFAVLSVTAGIAVSAWASPADARQTGAAAHGGPVSVVIDAVNPRIARPGGTVTVTGTVTDDAGTALSGLAVQLRSSAIPFTDRDELIGYADGQPAADAPVGTPEPVGGTLAAGRTVRWRVSIPVSAIGMDRFGVYPLAAQIVDASEVPLATARTFLPFWPGRQASGLAQPLKIAWIWPLVAPPQQGICPALSSDALAASVAPGGRLATLLATGAAFTDRADLTWAIDPALLGGVATMTSPYTVGGTADCTGGARKPADAAAARWLSELRTATTGQQVMLTPYADVDVAGLTAKGLDRDLATAYRLGAAEATAVLGRSFGPSPTSRSSTTLATGRGADDIAWPAGGLASASVLGNLAADGITAVVLRSSEMPPVATAGYVPDEAVTTTPTSIGTTMTVLLADDTLTRLLGAADGSPGNVFAISQRFLAETALIAAEAPSLPRAVVVAPPRQWDPSPTLAASLLAESITTPWLTPTSLASLAASGPPHDQVPRQSPPPTLADPRELGSSYLERVSAVDATLSLYESILDRPSQSYLDQLAKGVAATESSAWTSGAAGRRQGVAMVDRVLGYLRIAEHKVRVVGTSVRVTLGGASGKVPVSVSNGLRQRVRVWLRATSPSDGRIAVRPHREQITVPPGKTVTVSLSVRSAALGDSTIELWLTNGNGTPLPGTATSLGVQSTQFGGTLLVIIYGALGVLLLTGGARAVRRGLRDGRSPGRVRGREGDTGTARTEAGDAGSRAAGGAAEESTVGGGDDVTGSREPPEVPDDFADVWGRGGAT